MSFNHNKWFHHKYFLKLKSQATDNDCNKPLLLVSLEPLMFVTTRHKTQILHSVICKLNNMLISLNKMRKGLGQSLSNVTNINFIFKFDVTAAGALSQFKIQDFEK